MEKQEMTKQEYQYFQNIVMTVAKKCKMIDIAEEYMPDLIYKLYMSKDKFANKAKIETFYFTVARNQMLTYLSSHIKNKTDNILIYENVGMVDHKIEKIEEYGSQLEDLRYLIDIAIEENLFRPSHILFIRYALYGEANEKLIRKNKNYLRNQEKQVVEILTKLKDELNSK